MAKKTRRARKASQQQRAQNQARMQQHEDAPAGAVAAKSRRPNSGKLSGSLTAAQAAINFREEYRYVAADLRRVGILALVMFAVLIGLAFALPALGI